MAANESLAYKVINLIDVECPSCKQRVNSVPDSRAGKVAWLWCFTLFVFTGICCCVPFMVDGCKNVQQRCPNCNEIIKTDYVTCCNMDEG